MLCKCYAPISLPHKSVSSNHLLERDRIVVEVTYILTEVYILSSGCWWYAENPNHRDDP